MRNSPNRRDWFTNTSLLSAPNDRRCSVPPVPLGSDAHRRLGVELFNETWSLMEAGDPAMVRSAYASLYHWSHVAGPVQICRGEWLVSRVWCVLGEPGAA